MANALVTLEDTPIDLDLVTALYDEGRYQEALAAGLGDDVRTWSGTSARLIGARLAARLGAPRLSQALVFRAHRDDPSHPQATYFYAGLLFSRRGPWQTLLWLEARRDGLPENADFLSLEAEALAGLRDLDRAQEKLDAALELNPDNAWLHCLHAGLAEHRDDVDGALEITAAALASFGNYRPLLYLRSRLLASQQRLEEAHELLGIPLLHQSYELLSLRAELAFGLRRYDACESDLAAAAASATLLEDRVERHLAASRAEAAYLCRAHRRAEKLARRVRTKNATSFADALAELEDGAEPPRVELHDVPHIRQHHVTCMPASLTAVARFHGEPVEHEEVAAAICYAGTPLHAAARWAHERGYAVREFDLTFDLAVALIDARLPIVLTTARAAGAHSQVVVGYDRARRSLLIRDPGTPSLLEMPSEAIERQAWSGPHALVFAPPSRADDLGAFDLGPSAARWDLSQAVYVALEAHDVVAAKRVVKALRRDDPGSRHALSASLDVALYEGRVDAQLVCLDGLLELHPDTPAWVLRRGEAMRARSSLDERIAYWERYEDLKEPSILEALAEDLRQNAHHQAKARFLLHRALRLDPYSGMAHHVLADLRVSRSEGGASTLDSYRFAACLSPADEHFARAYFEHARACGQDAEALALLERRAEGAGDRATGPARTLFDVYNDSGSPERGLEILERLAERRPDDGDLALMLVDAHLSAGDPQAATEWLTRSEGRTANEADRLHAASRVARQAGDLRAARAALEACFSLTPSRVDRLDQLADVLLELEGPDAAVECVERALAAAPDDGLVLAELSRRLRGRDDERRRALLLSRLEARPDDDWARRELALAEATVGDMDAALDQAHDAAARTPWSTSAFTVLGDLLLRSGDTVGARAALRRAIELHVDNAPAIQLLCQSATDPAEARDDARFVLDRLERHVSAGPGIVEAAYSAVCLPHDERGARLEKLLDMASHRPDAWEAMVRVRLDAGDLDEALSLAARACARFPRWFPLKFIEAEVLRIAGDPTREEASLRALLELTPAWLAPRRRLSEVLRERGALALAAETIEEGLRRAPRASALHRERAILHFLAGERDEAFSVLLRALEAGFLDQLAFETLAGWANAQDRVGEVEVILRRQAAQQAHLGGPWYRLGVLLTAPDRVDDRLESLRATLRISPRFAPAADLLAVTLASAGRYDEALAACPPAEWVGPVPHAIEGRRAWVLGRCGQLEDAIEVMTELLEKAPDYAWGRRQLCDWLDRAGRAADFLTHAERLVSEAPNVASSHVYLADARRLAADLQGARDSFARAVKLDPSNPYASAELLALLLDDDDLDEAERLLEWTRHCLTASAALAAEVRIAAARRSWPDALAKLDAMLEEPVSSGTLRMALDAFDEGAQLDAALALVEARFEDPAAGADIGFAWADVVDARERPGLGRVLSLEDRLGPAGVSAVAVGIEHLGARRRGWALAWHWLWHGRWLRREDATWGAFGFALLELGWVRLCVRWLANFETRAVHPWMLMNMVVAAWMLGRGAVAERAAATALTLPRDQTSDRHHLWALFHRALDGGPGGLAAEMRRLPASNMETALPHLVEALEIASDMDGASRVEIQSAVAPAIAAARAVAVDHPKLDRPIAAVVARTRG